jgi:FkbM family methyltransferase
MHLKKAYLILKNYYTKMKSIKNLFFKICHGFRGFPFVIHGEKFRVDESLRRWRTDGESWLFEHMKSNLRPGDDMIDVGGNFGFMTLYAGRLVGPNGRVVSFEPVPSHANLLRSNIKLNRMNDYCIVAQCVVSDLPEKMLQMVFAKSGADPTAAIAANQQGKDRVNVRNVALDDYAYPAGFAPRMIKIDVEGAELAVLRSGPKLLTQFKPVIILEVHGKLLGNFSATEGELFEYLSSFGYSEWDRQVVIDSSDGCYHVLLKST